MSRTCVARQGGIGSVEMGTNALPKAFKIVDNNRTPPLWPSKMHLWSLFK